MALPDGILSTEELLDAQSHIWNHTYSFINSMSLKCAVELKIPDIIHNHNKPTKLSELANALSINQAKTPCLGRLMRILIHSKFFIMAKIDVLAHARLSSSPQRRAIEYCALRALRRGTNNDNRSRASYERMVQR
ncbi:hypothetical protein ACS0TY_017890 [Phlomoides rotata]